MVSTPIVTSDRFVIFILVFSLILNPTPMGQFSSESVLSFGVVTLLLKKNWWIVCVLSETLKYVKKHVHIVFVPEENDINIIIRGILLLSMPCPIKRLVLLCFGLCQPKRFSTYIDSSVGLHLESFHCFCEFLWSTSIMMRRLSQVIYALFPLVPHICYRGVSLRLTRASHS